MTELKSSFIELKTRPFFDRLVVDAQRINFACALRDSLTIDINASNPKPATVKDLSNDYNFQIDILKDYFIVLKKPLAKEFLKDFGVTYNRAFDRVYNRDLYRTVFDREPFVVGTRQMLLTYAEWLHFVGYPFEPKIPDFISEWLR